MAKNQGIKSRNNREVGVRTGRGAVKVNKAAVNQLGAHTGDHVTEKRGSTGYRGEDLVRGKGYNVGKGFGNEVALNVGGGGPGVGYRQIGKSGQQGTHGPVNAGEPMPRKELWPGWSK